MAKFLGIEFAPRQVPVERRLQTLAVVGHIFTIALAGPTAIVMLAYMILFTRFYWLALAYVCYMIGERGVASRGGHHSMWARRWAWWRYYRDYFPIKLVKTAELDPSRNYLLCCFPHGIISSGTFGNLSTEATNVSGVFPGLKHHMITLNSNFWLPIARELLLLVGLCSANRESLNYLLDPSKEGGRAVALVVGGAAESLHCKPGTHRVVLKNRKGFARVALHNGASVVPVFTFGETDLYDQVDNPEGSWLRLLQDWFRKVTGVAPVLAVGRGVFQYSFGLLPRRRPLTTVVGAPIAAEHIPNPPQEKIDELHEKFTAALVALFEEHKHRYVETPDQATLTID